MIRMAFSTAPRAVTWLGLGCLVLLFIKGIILNRFPAAFPLAQELGLIADSVLASVVAAYLFFVLSIQLPYVREQAHLSGVIANLASSAANRVTGFLQMIAGSGNRGILDPATVDESVVKTLFRSVSPNGPAPMTIDPSSASLTWMEAMIRHDEQCHASINRVWRYARFLDSELVSLLNELEDSRHSSSMHSHKTYAKGAVVMNPTLEVWSDNYYAAYDAARRLVSYLHLYRRKFQVGE